MKKVNFKKRVSQLMAGVFGLALMGGVMLSAVKVEAQKLDGFNITSKSVRMPVPVLCESETRYWTDCQASGQGCDMTDCTTDPKPSLQAFTRP